VVVEIGIHEEFHYLEDLHVKVLAVLHELEVFDSDVDVR
jgi:hypothetical protein